MNVQLMDLKRQYQSLRGEILTRIEEVLQGMELFLGENVFRLEEEFARYCGASYAVGVGSGTDALHLALRAAGIGPGDEVITVAHTFAATVEAILYTGARPVLVDVDPVTCTMDVEQVAAAVGPRTRAIVPVHLYGHPADMDGIMAVARRHGLFVLEDACQAHGAMYRGRRVGSLGDAAAFSFYYSKNLGAYGEGGMAVTNDRALATRMQMLRNHGSKAKNRHALLGYNARLDEIQAAVLRVKLPRLDRWNTLRRNWARQYTQQLADLEEITTPVELPHVSHVYHLYVIQTAERDALQQWLKRHDIATGVHYPVPVHLQEAYRGLGYPAGSLPVTEALAERILSLPMYPELTLDKVSFVSQSIRDFLRRRHRRSRRAALSGATRK
jgi:dTDP-4-amino-4,6-dideoxygalactose transaminase